MAEVRPFEARDAEAVLSVVKAVFDHYGFTWEADGYCADIVDVAGHYQLPFGRFWVAELEGRVVGCVGLKLFDPIQGERGKTIETKGVPVKGKDLKGKVRVATADCELVRLYVHPSAWGNKLGKALTQTVVRDARNRAKTLMELWTDKKLTHAHHMYMAFGAKIVGDRLCDDPDVSPEWGMMLPLI